MEARHTVLLDETSLPEDQNLVLKETHDHLDHPRVSSVILSNAIMDVPNTNRVALLVQLVLTEEDLYELTRFTLFGRNVIEAEKALRGNRVYVTESSSREDMKFAHALCSGFMAATKVRHAYRKQFQHRDYIYFLRFLRDLSSKHSEGELRGHRSVTAANLLHALRRHLNGYDLADFKQIASSFFKCLLGAGFSVHEWALDEKAVEEDKSLEMIVESLEHRIGEGESPNTASFRYTSLPHYPSIS